MFVRSFVIYSLSDDVKVLSGFWAPFQKAEKEGYLSDLKTWSTKTSMEHCCYCLAQNRVCWLAVVIGFSELNLAALVTL